MSIPADTAAVSRARRFAADRLERWGLGPLVDTAILLVSELVTNAIIHGHSAPRLTLLLESGVLRAEVRDTSEFVPRTRRYSRTATTGRGMLIVEAMASAWGAELEEAGKVVWFEIHVGDQPGSAGPLPARRVQRKAVTTPLPSQAEHHSEPSRFDFPSARILVGAGC